MKLEGAFTELRIHPAANYFTTIANTTVGHQYSFLYWGQGLTDHYREGPFVFVKWGTGKQRCAELLKEARIYKKLQDLRDFWSTTKVISPTFYGYFESTSKGSGKEDPFGMTICKCCFHVNRLSGESVRVLRLGMSGFLYEAVHSALFMSRSLYALFTL